MGQETQEYLYFNGIDGASGEYLVPPLTPSQVSALAQGQSLDPEELDQLQMRVFQLQNPHAGVEVADHRDLAQTGWGVIFPHDADPAIREALSPLLQHRARQAGALYKEFNGPLGYRPGEAKGDFLMRFEMGPGPVAPEKVPYYLLLVGSPEAIPYRFQCQLDVQYAVGRIHFDTIEEYDQYARSVVAAETGLALPPTALFFGVANEADKATNLSLENLIQPLAQTVREEGARWAAQAQPGDRPAPAWQVQTLLKGEATKARLSELFHSPQAPALFFSASHGISFPRGDSRQFPHQGALVCQDWPGPQAWRGPLQEEHYFSADDLGSQANLLGTIAFFFACYGAGTPRYDEFSAQLWQGQPGRREIAPQAFLARLPRRMLSLPRGGALAVIGHVERAWGSSFYWGRAGKQLTVFEDSLERLLKGNYPVGYALEVFNNRYAEISTDLSSKIEDARFGMKLNDLEMANLWTANNDARNYVVLGDPAARLTVGAEGSPERPALESIAIHVEPVGAAAPGGNGSASAGAESQPAAAASPASAFAVSPEVGMQPGQEPSPETGEQARILEIATYTHPDLAQLEPGPQPFPGARLAALTRLLADGSLHTWVAEGEAQNGALLKTHQEMVAQALHRRAAMQ